MSNPVEDARAGLEAALAAQGLRVLPPGGQAAPPCVFVIPGDPWVSPYVLGQRMREVSQRVVGLVGTASDAAERTDTEAMANALADAIHRSPPWTLATIAAPTPYDVGGVAYLAVVATTTIAIAGG